MNKVTYIAAVLILSSCINHNEHKEIDSLNFQDSSAIARGQEVRELEKFIFTGTLQEWFNIGAGNGDFFRLEGIDEVMNDTLTNLYLEYILGVYLIRSSRLGILVRVPLFAEPNNIKEIPCSSEYVFTYYYQKYRNNLMFKWKNDYSLICRYELVNEEQKIYRIYHEEYYQPSFEDAPEIKGVRIFTINTTKGVVDFETKKLFDVEWY